LSKKRERERERRKKEKKGKKAKYCFEARQSWLLKLVL
jgi:hypothetical protein